MPPSARAIQGALARVGAVVIVVVLVAPALVPRGDTATHDDGARVLVAGSTLVDFGGGVPNESRIGQASLDVMGDGLWQAGGYRPFDEYADPTNAGGFGLERTVPWNEGVRLAGWMTFHHSQEGGDWVRLRLEGWTLGEGAGTSPAYHGMVEHILRGEASALGQYLDRWGWSPGTPSLFLEAAGGCPLPATP